MIQLFDLPLPAEEIFLIVESTACHRSARRERLAREGDHIKRMLIFLSEPDRVVDRIDDDRPAKQLGPKVLVDLRTGREVACQTDDTFLGEDFLPHGIPAGTDVGERQEGCPAVLILLQEFDVIFSGIFVVGNNVPDTAAQGGLDGDLILFLCGNEIRDDTVYSRILLFLFHDAADRVPIPLVMLVQRAQRVETGVISVITRLNVVQQCIGVVQLLLEFCDLSLFYRRFCPKGFNMLTDPFKIPVRERYPVFRCLFLLGETEHTRLQLCPADVDLFEKRTVALHFPLDGRAAVEHPDDVVLCFRDPVIAGSQSPLDVLIFLLFLFLLAPGCFQLSG